MSGNDITTPVYVITGFLDSGKTSFLKFTTEQDYFRIDETTLLIACEEGEEEYDKKKLETRYHTVVESIENEEDFNIHTLRALQKKHNPGRVIIEYNPLWGVGKLEQMSLPRGWGIVQEIVIADASTFSVYMNNMKSLFVEMSRNAEMILFNRCTEELPLASFRRSIKVVNPGCDVQFMGLDGRPIDIFRDMLPYDMEKDPIEIEDMDYGIFFVDMQDDPEKYEGRKVKFKGQVIKSRQMGAEFFVPARSAMTCCADDIQYIGYFCRSAEAPKLEEGSWVTVTAEVHREFLPMAGGEESVLTAVSIEPAGAPDTELVYFT
ncbi:MAG: GTPase [Eubacterium sp.]|nr:GTPase [Eubacterium sp.]